MSMRMSAGRIRATCEFIKAQRASPPRVTARGAGRSGSRRP